MFENIPFVLAQPGKAPGGNTGGTTSTPTETTGTTPDTPGTPGNTGSQNSDSPFGGSFFFILIGGLLLMFVLMSGGQRKEKKKRKAMLENLKKGDKVQTLGGILGNVIEVKDSHVVVKVDENNNTRLKFSRSAIQGVVGGQDKEPDKSEIDKGKEKDKVKD